MFRSALFQIVKNRAFFQYALWLHLTLAIFIAARAVAATDYETELLVLEKGIAESGPPRGALIRLDLLYRRANLTRTAPHLRAAQAAIDAFQTENRPLAPLSVLRARLALHLHDPARARSELAASGLLESSTVRRDIEFDLALQSGDYQIARALCSSSQDASWEALSRAANLKALFGDPLAADKLYAQAEEQLTAKEMRSYAWVRVQRGILCFRAGNFPEAAAHYARASKAYSGCWWVERQQAELLAAQGNAAAAVDLYRKLSEQLPELQQELGDLFAFLGRGAEAKAFYEKARTAYLASASRGEALYIHHLTSLLSDAFEDGPGALQWARKDLEARPGFASRDAVAWALYRSGDFAGAKKEMDRALASGAVDTHLFFHAALICAAALDSPEAARFFHLVADLNPKYLSTFHAHR